MSDKTNYSTKNYILFAKDKLSRKVIAKSLKKRLVDEVDIKKSEDQIFEEYFNERDMVEDDIKNEIEALSRYFGLENCLFLYLHSRDVDKILNTPLSLDLYSKNTYTLNNIEELFSKIRDSKLSSQELLDHDSADKSEILNLEN